MLAVKLAVLGHEGFPFSSHQLLPSIKPRGNCFALTQDCKTARERKRVIKKRELKAVRAHVWPFLEHYWKKKHLFGHLIPVAFQLL